MSILSKLVGRNDNVSAIATKRSDDYGMVPLDTGKPIIAFMYFWGRGDYPVFYPYMSLADETEVVHYNAPR